MSSNQKKSLLFSLFGNVIEYFDYALYGFLATEISAHFFSNSSVQAGISKTFFVFALGFLAKPLGNILFSRIGDYHGRAKVLRLSLWFIFIATLGLALLPSHQSWGLYSAAGLIACRFLQGFAIGGEANGVTLIVSEYLGPKHQHLALGLSGLSASIGILLASYAARLLANDVVTNWQTFYLIGALVCFVFIFLRKNLIESPHFQKHKDTPVQRTLPLLKGNWPFLLVVVFIMGGNGGLYHFYIVFLNAYSSDLLTFFTQKEGANISFYATLGYTLSSIIMGLLADRFSPSKMIPGLLILLFIVLTGSFLSLFLQQSFLIIFFLGGFFIGASGIPLLASIIHFLDTRKRHRIIGFGHVIGSCLLSGTAPMMGTKIFYLSSYGPVFYGYFLFSLYVTGYLGLVFLMKKGQGQGAKN